MGGEPADRVPHPWPSFLLLDLFLLSLLILATRLATFLHEVMGHALAAGLFGADLRGVRLSLFGGGNAYYHFGAALAPLPAFLVAFSGILVNLTTGLFAFRWSERHGMSPAALLFLSLFGMVSLLGALNYTCLGFYYQVGDPVAWGRNPFGADWAWIPFFAASLPAAFLGVRFFLRPLRPWFPSTGFAGKATALALTLGLTSCAYAGLYGLTRQRSVALDTRAIAYNRVAEEVRREKNAALLEQVRRVHPEWTEEEALQWVEQNPLSVRPEEVPQRFPLMPFLAVCQVLAALSALCRPPPAPSCAGFRLSPGPMALAMLLVGAVLAFLFHTGGWLWGTR